MKYARLLVCVLVPSATLVMFRMNTAAAGALTFMQGVVTGGVGAIFGGLAFAILSWWDGFRARQSNSLGTEGKTEQRPTVATKVLWVLALVLLGVFLLVSFLVG
jgi:hypothetical protein